MSPWTTGSSPVVTWWVLFDLHSTLKAESPDHSGTFHKTNRKCVPLYVAEFQFRYNHRFSGGLIVSGDGASAAIAFIFTNVGNSPAIKLSHHVGLVVLATCVSLPDEQARVCDAAKNQWQSGFTLFPHDQFPGSLGAAEYSIGANASREAIQGGLAASPDKKGISLFAVGCIDYTFTTDSDAHHQTPFIRQISKKFPRIISPISIDDKMIPADQLEVREFGIGVGRAAD